MTMQSVLNELSKRDELLHDLAPRLRVPQLEVHGDVQGGHQEDADSGCQQNFQ